MTPKGLHSRTRLALVPAPVSPGIARSLPPGWSTSIPSEASLGLRFGALRMALCCPRGHVLRAFRVPSSLPTSWPPRSKGWRSLTSRWSRRAGQAGSAACGPLSPPAAAGGPRERAAKGLRCYHRPQGPRLSRPLGSIHHRSSGLLGNLGHFPRSTPSLRKQALGMPHLLASSCCPRHPAGGLGIADRPRVD